MCKRDVMVCAVLAWIVCCIFTFRSFSHNLLRKKWHISATLLLFGVFLCGAEKEKKVAPDTY